MGNSCSLSSINEEISNEYKRLQEMLDDGITVDDNGVSVEESMSTLKELSQATKAKDEEAVDAVIAQYESMVDNELANTLRQEFGTTIPVAFNGSNSVQNQVIKNVTSDGEYIKVVTNKGTWKFLMGQDRSTQTESGKYVVVRGMGEYTSRNLEEHIEAYGNTKEGKANPFDWENADRVEHNLIGNISNMQNMLDTIHELGGKKEDVGHVKYLKGLLGKMSPEFFEKMTLFIKEGAQRDPMGIVQSSRVGITTNNSPKAYGNQMSEAETYSHEVIHTMIQWALNSGLPEANKLKRELDYVMREALLDGLNWKTFLPEVSIDPVEEEKAARARYKYVFEGDTALDEFIAHALTNKELMAKLARVPLKNTRTGENWRDKIANFFEDVVNTILGNYKFSERNRTAYEQVLDLTWKLGEINTKKNIELAYKGGISDAVMNVINDIDDAIAEKLHGIFTKYIKDDKPVGKMPNDSKVQKAMWLARSMWRMSTNSNYRAIAGMVATTIGIQPEGLIRNVLRDFTEATDMEKAVEWLGLAASKIDASRMAYIQAAKGNLLHKFKELPTKYEEEAMTAVILDTDIQGIWDRYTAKKIKDMLLDKDKLRTEIGRVKHQLLLADKDNYNWNTNQAHGLGFYMATGAASLAQNFNSYTIARGVHSGMRRKANKAVMRLIDDIATLTALENTDTRQKKAFKELYDKDPEAVTNTVRIARGFVNQSRKKLFDGNTTHFVKGYSRELFDDTMTMQVAPTSERAKMEAAGYEWKKVLNTHSAENRPKEMSLYVTKSFEVSERLRTAVRLNKKGAKGTSLKELYSSGQGNYSQERGERQKIIFDELSRKEAAKMVNGTYNPDNIETGVAPIIDDEGNTVDYRYMMDKKAKKSLLNQDTTIGEVVGRSYGTVEDKVYTDEHNTQVLQTILDDMANNYKPGSNVGIDMKTEYVTVGPNVSDPKMKEIFDMLPHMFKQAAYDRDDKVLAVPATLQHAYFGYKHLSITDIPGLEKVTPQVLRSLIKMAEGMWMEMMKIVKTNILMKMPFVLVQNIVSNFLYAVMTGTSPITLLKMYTESFQDTRRYIKDHRRAYALEIKKSSGILSRKESAELKLLGIQMKKSEINELMELGLYQALVEDVDTADLRSTNKWKKIVEDKMAKAPGFVKYGTDIMFLTENTKWYQFNQEVLQMSDLIARDVMNRKLKLQEKDVVKGGKRVPTWWLDELASAKVDGYVGPLKGVVTQELTQGVLKGSRVPDAMTGREKKVFLSLAKVQRHNALLNAFINYDKPSSRGEEYLNKMGPIMFTKYTKRIQKVLTDMTTGHPLNASLAVLGQSFLVDFDTVQDQSMFLRAWDDSRSVIPIYSPWDHLINVGTPALIKDTTYRLY